MVRKRGELDCPNCAGTGIVRFGAQCVGDKWVPIHCDECAGTGIVYYRRPGLTFLRPWEKPPVQATYPDDEETDLDRKLRAYTSVGEMSNAAFRRLIDGRWKGERVYERDGELHRIQLTPVDEIDWTNGDKGYISHKPTREQFERSNERSDRKAMNMFEHDEQDERETAYQKYARYMKEQNGVDVEVDGPSIPRR